MILRKIFTRFKNAYICINNYIIFKLMKYDNGATELFVNILRWFPEKIYERRIHRIISSFECPFFTPDDFHKGRVEYFIGALGPGGAERQMVYTACEVLDKGFEVGVTCQNLSHEEHNLYADTLREKGIPVKSLPEIEALDDLSCINSGFNEKAVDKIKNTFKKLDIQYFEQQVIRFMAAIMKTRPEIVHAWLDEVNIEAGLAAMIMGVPKIIMGQRNVSPYHFAFYQPFMRPGYRFMSEDGRVVMVNNSKGGLKDYVRWIGLSEDRIKVLYNGYPEPSEVPSVRQVNDFRRRMGIFPETLVVGSVFRFSDEKRPIFWLKTAKMILNRRPDAKFLLVGDGTYRTSMYKKMAEMGLEGKVIFTGVLKNPYLAIKAMDVFLLTSKNEGLPNVLVEAQSLGVPVVTTDVGGASEAILPDITGFAVAKATPELMANKVIEVLEDPAWRNKAKKIAPEFVRDKFSLEKMIRETLKIYGYDLSH